MTAIYLDLRYGTLREALLTLTDDHAPWTQSILAIRTMHEISLLGPLGQV